MTEPKIAEAVRRQGRRRREGAAVGKRRAEGERGEGC